MKDDGGNGADIVGKALDFGAFGAFDAIKSRPLCNLYLERCIKSNGI
jgi:hypothetical protein